MIDKKQVEHIARLSRLLLKAEEKDTFGSQLSSIIRYMDKLNELDTHKLNELDTHKLNELDTKDIEPTSHVVDIANVMRDDAPMPSLSPDEALGNAPRRAENFYRVPKIIE